MARKPAKPTHRATLADGSTVDYFGAHPTHWTFGGVDKDGNRDGSRVRTVAVTSVHPLESYEDAEVPDEDEDDEDGE